MRDHTATCGYTNISGTSALGHSTISVIITALQLVLERLQARFESGCICLHFGKTFPTFNTMMLGLPYSAAIFLVRLNLFGMLFMDVTVTQAINQLSGKNPFMDSLFIAVSAYGIPVLVAAVALQWWRKDERPTIRHTLLSAGFSFLLGLGLNQLVLLVAARVRPYDAGVTHLIIAPSADPSFPSDHAMAAMAIAAAFLLSRYLRPQGWLLLFAAIIISFSRVFVGIHYVTDVLGGALIGVLAALAVRLAYKPESRVNRFLTSIF